MCWAHCQPSVRVTGLVRLALTRPTTSFPGTSRDGSHTGTGTRTGDFGGGRRRETGSKGAPALFSSAVKENFQRPSSPGLVHAEPEKVRTKDSGAPNPTLSRSQGPHLFFWNASPGRGPTPQSILSLAKLSHL